jgi:hypothetical protein
MEITDLGLIGIKIESAYGTDPTPTKAASLIPVVAGSFNYDVETSPIPRKMIDGTLDAIPGFNTLPNVTAKFSYDVRGNRTNGVATDISLGNISKLIEIDPLLRAANLDATYTAESSGGARDGYVIYSPAAKTDEGPSVTLYWWSAKKLHKLLGGKVDVALTMEAGRMARLEFTLRGKYSAVTDASWSTSGVTYLDTVPPLWLSGTINVGSVAPIISRLSFNLGNQIAMREDATQAYGHKGFIITGMSPTMSIDPESEAEATHPIWSDLIAGTQRSTTVVMGADTGNKFAAIIGVMPTKVTYGDRNKTRIVNINYEVCKSALTAAAGSHIQLKFY